MAISAITQWPHHQNTRGGKMSSSVSSSTVGRPLHGPREKKIMKTRTYINVLMTHIILIIKISTHNQA